MDPWTGKSAFVTGAASGIGRALARALAARGARVCVADIEGDGAQGVAQECGGGASAVRLDVRDAAAVRAAIEAFAAAAGRLDYVFNNAGVGAGGEVEEIPLAAWQRVIDVNVYGVLHGVLAAYPIMLRQRSGHIVNTASAAGLGPAPLLTPYALSKHAVVGLSTSLRLEAEPRGVRVSALCPGLIDTPILATPKSNEFQLPWAPDARRYLTALAGAAYPVEKMAEETLAAVARNERVIVVPARARVGWRIGRLFPGFVEKMYAAAVARERGWRTTAAAPRPLPEVDPAIVAREPSN